MWSHWLNGKSFQEGGHVLWDLIMGTEYKDVMPHCSGRQKELIYGQIE